MNWQAWWACMRDMKRLRIIREIRLDARESFGDPVVLCQEDDAGRLPQRLQEKLHDHYKLVHSIE